MQIKENSKALKSFLKENFDYPSLKKAGFFLDIKFNDYEGQAEKICKFFRLKTIYDYGKHEIRCHITYAGDRPILVDENGQLKTIPFVETIFPNQLHI